MNLTSCPYVRASNIFYPPVYTCQSGNFTRNQNLCRDLVRHVVETNLRPENWCLKQEIYLRVSIRHLFSSENSLSVYLIFGFFDVFHVRLDKDNHERRINKVIVILHSHITTRGAATVKAAAKFRDRGSHDGAVHSHGYLFLIEVQCYSHRGP